MNPKYYRYFNYVKPVFTNPFVKNYSSIVFSLITITIFSLFAIRPTIKTIVVLQKDIEQQKQVLEQLETKLNNLGRGKQNYQAIDQEVKDKLVLLLPNKPALAEFIEELSQMSISNQATISGLQFQPVTIENKPFINTAKPEIVEVTFTYNTQAAYPQLVETLKSLNLATRLTNINSVIFNKPETANLIMSIEGKAFFLK